MLLGHRLLEGNCGHFLAISIIQNAHPFLLAKLEIQTQELSHFNQGINKI